MPALDSYAFEQYKETKIVTANQGKLIVMLYDGAIKFLNIALDNMDDPRTYDVANNNIIKAQDIITELILSLNMEEGGQISENLLNLYVYFKRQLLDANIQKNKELALPILNHLKSLRDAWDKVSASETKSDTNMGYTGSFSAEG
jgi:flagellar protein FliS